MEVKDVRSTKLVNDSRVVQNSQSKSNNQAENVKAEDAVKANVSERGNSDRSKTQTRIELNNVINAGNVAKEATVQIGRIVQSISGIIKLATNEDIPEKRRATLEKEANQLVEEIKKTADTQATNGVRPLAGDKIKLEVEEKIGKTLDVILPDDAKNAFGLPEIDFSTKDSIIATIANVKQAEESILKLKDAVEEASKDIEDAARTVDVALQNSEAAEASIRDLDQALKVAGLTKAVISEDPKKAMESLGDLGSNSLGLLD